MVKARASSFQSLQQWFMNQMESCLMWEIAMLELPDKALQPNLRQLTMVILDPDHPYQWLFHSVGKTFMDDGLIFWFHPSKSQHARGIVTRGRNSTLTVQSYTNSSANEPLIVQQTCSGIQKLSASWLTQTLKWRHLHQDEDFHFPR